MNFIDAEHKPPTGYIWPIALISVALLAACTANQPTAPAHPAAYTYQPPPLPPVRPHHRAIAKPKPDLTPSIPGEAPANPAPSEPVALLPAPAETPGAGFGDVQEVAPVPVASELVGLDEQRATKLLGPAAATDARSPATVWHYKSSRCELDLVFYMEMRSGRMRTLHYEFKSGAETPQQRQACLRTIVQENSKNAANSN